MTKYIVEANIILGQPEMVSGVKLRDTKHSCGQTYFGDVVVLAESLELVVKLAHSVLVCLGSHLSHLVRQLHRTLQCQKDI